MIQILFFNIVLNILIFILIPLKKSCYSKSHRVYNKIHLELKVSLYWGLIYLCSHLTIQESSSTLETRHHVKWHYFWNAFTTDTLRYMRVYSSTWLKISGACSSFRHIATETLHHPYVILPSSFADTTYKHLFKLQHTVPY